MIAACQLVGKAINVPSKRPTSAKQAADRIVGITSQCLTAQGTQALALRRLVRHDNGPRWFTYRQQTTRCAAARFLQRDTTCTLSNRPQPLHVAVRSRPNRAARLNMLSPPSDKPSYMFHLMQFGLFGSADDFAPHRCGNRCGALSMLHRFLIGVRDVRRH